MFKTLSNLIRLNMRCLGPILPFSLPLNSSQLPLRLREVIQNVTFLLILHCKGDIIIIFLSVPYVKPMYGAAFLHFR